MQGRRWQSWRSAFLFVVLTSLLLTASASASTQVSGPPWQLTWSSPVAGSPALFRLGGSAAGTAPADPDADTDPAAALAVLPPGSTCPGSYAEVTGAIYSNSWHWIRGEAASEPYDLTGIADLHVPGSYPACAYFGLEGQASLDFDPLATLYNYAPAQVVVARPSVTANLKLDGTIAPNRWATITGTVTSNAPVNVTIQLNHAADACAANSAVNASLATSSIDLLVPVFGSAQVLETVQLPPLADNYILCTYAYRDGFEADPDLVLASTPYASLPQPTKTYAPLIANGKDGTVKLACTVARSARRPRRIRLSCPGANDMMVAELWRNYPTPKRVRQKIGLTPAGIGYVKTSSLRTGTWRLRLSWHGWVTTSTKIKIKR